MASLSLLNGNYTEEELANACFLMATSNSGVTNVHNSMTMARIAPRMEQDELLRCKRRIQKGHLPSMNRGTHQPAAVARRNERERNRVRLVNMGFATLRQHVPTSVKSKKMSKVDTLRSAVDYIKQLQQLLGAEVSPGCSADENSYPSGSGASSPTPSICSEESSAYDVVREDDDELMDFGSWF